MTEEKPYFESLENLYIDRIFLEYESEPIIFSLKDKQKELYLAWCPEVRLIKRWYIIHCKDKQLYHQLINSLINIKLFIEKHETAIEITVKATGEETNRVINIRDIDKDYIPDEVYL